MLWGIFSAILSSSSTVFYRLSIREWSFGKSSFALVANWIGTLMGIGAFIWFSRDWIQLVDLLTLSVFCGIMISSYYNGTQILELNKTEKVSTIQIFGNINTILTLIAGFLLFGKTSIITLSIAIFCGIIVLASQFENGAFQPPKEWKKIVTTMSVGAINGLVIVWLIGEISSTGYFIASSVAATFIAVVVLTIQRNISEITKGNKKFYLFRVLDGITFNSVRFVRFYLIGSLGPVVSTLLGMLGNIVTLIFSSFFLGEKNSIKTWLINVVLCVLVGLGFYFK